MIFHLTEQEMETRSVYNQVLQVSPAWRPGDSLVLGVPQAGTLWPAAPAGVWALRGC